MPSPRIPIAEAVSAYQAGEPLRIIAERYGVTKEAVRQALHRAGVPLRKRGGNQGAHSRHKA